MLLLGTQMTLPLSLTLSTWIVSSAERPAADGLRPPRTRIVQLAPAPTGFGGGAAGSTEKL